MQNIQNRIDRLISNANNEFSEQRNVIAAIIEYSKSLDLFDFMDKTYKIQTHEVLVRIAICFDILGNFTKTLEFLNKSLNLINNVSSLILYKSVLLQTIGKSDEAQKILIKFKQISNKRHLELYETFRLIFFHTMGLEKEVLLYEINEFCSKYSKNAVILYLRAMVYLDFSNSINKRENDYYSKYEKDIKEASEIEPTDTEYLLKDGITNENLTKLYFMILPDMDFYQPKPLVNYYTFQSGFKLFYVIFKIIKIFKIKVEKKKLKINYTYKLKQLRLKEKDNSESSNNHSNNSLLNQYNYENNIHCDNTNSQNKVSTMNTETEIINTHRPNHILKNSSNKNSDKNIISDRIKRLNIVKIKSKVEKASINENINEIKKEYENKVKKLFRSVWLANIKYNELSYFNLSPDIDTNFFIFNKYYSPQNLKESLIIAVKQNNEYNINYHKHSNLRYKSENNLKNNNMMNNFNPNNINKKNEIIDIFENNSIGRIKERDNTLSFSSDFNLQDTNLIYKFKDINKSDNSSVGYKLSEKDNTLNINKKIDNIVKKLVHKQSPRMNLLKFNSSNNKFINISKERKTINKDENSNANNTNNTNIGNSMMKNGINTIERKDLSNFKKSLEISKNKIPEILFKKVNKPTLFKNLNNTNVIIKPLRVSNISGGNFTIKSDNI